MIGAMLLTLWFLTLCVPSALCASRIMVRTNGVYCAGSTLQPPSGITRSRPDCVMKCLRTAGCVAFSYRADSQCLLHDAWCSPGDLLTELATVHAGNNLGLFMNYIQSHSSSFCHYK